MRFHSGFLSHGRLGFWLILLFVAFLGACVISPRRIVGNNSSPTPTPGISPTPTPTATPTASPMETAVPSQFLFTANPEAGLVLGFKINSDGGLSPVPGSPFELPDSPRLLAAMGNQLFVAGKSGLAALAVNQETGAISRTGPFVPASVTDLAVEPSSRTVFAGVPNGQLALRVVNNRIQVAPGHRSAVIQSPADAPAGKDKEATDASGKFLYVLNSTEGVISVFRMQDGKPTPLSPARYPAGQSASSLAIVVP